MVSYLEDEFPEFRLSDMATAMSCTTERIRLMRQKDRPITVDDLIALRETYGVNELFLTQGKKPYVFPKGSGSLGEDSSMKYKQEITALKAQLQARDKVIAEKDLLNELLKEKLDAIDKPGKKKK